MDTTWRAHWNYQGNTWASLGKQFSQNGPRDHLVLNLRPQHQLSIHLGTTWTLILGHYFGRHYLGTTWAIGHCLGATWALLAPFGTTWVLHGHYLGTFSWALLLHYLGIIFCRHGKSLGTTLGILEVSVKSICGLFGHFLRTNGGQCVDCWALHWRALFPFSQTSNSQINNKFQDVSY